MEKLIGKLCWKIGWKICWKCWVEMLGGNLAGNVGWKFGWKIGWKCWLNIWLEKMLVNGCEIIGEKIVATNLPLRLSTTPTYRIVLLCVYSAVTLSHYIYSTNKNITVKSEAEYFTALDHPSRSDDGI